VEFLFSKGLVKTRVLEKLRGNRTISEAVRQKAFVFVNPCWKGVVYQQAVCWVDSLFAKPILNPEAIESARNNRALGEELRQKAAALSDRRRKDADLLKDASWAIVRTPGADASAYCLALSQAKHACRLAPDNSKILTTLGVAQYRVGQYLQAVETLAQCDRICLVHDYGCYHPANQAFLAMALYRLGQTEKALDHLDNVRVRKDAAWWAKNEEVLMREAEALLQAQTVKPRK
jgi:tetratricopeptide (TPR) repeat protein